MTTHQKLDIEQAVTHKIIARLEAGGLLPWACPWERSLSGGSLPFNGATQVGYNGINIVILWLAAQEQGYSSNNWMTFKQALQLGGQVDPGEKGTHCVFYKPVPKHKDLSVDDEDQEFFACRKVFTVFNIDQISGLAAAPAVAQQDHDESHIARRVNLIADAYCKAESIRVRHGGNKAYYSPLFDHVKLPTSFYSDGGFASTYMHELIHSTGHPKRLNRFEANTRKFGSHNESYAFEELTASIGESIFCAELGIRDQDESHASYIANWLTHLKNDKTFIFKAAAAASKAYHYIMQYSDVKMLEDAA